MGKEKYNKEELIILLIHEGKSYKEVAGLATGMEFKMISIIKVAGIG